jgi:hypothetical protein
MQEFVAMDYEGFEPPPKWRHHRKSLFFLDFYTFRYWRATMEYRRLHDFGAVMVLLGHKLLRYVLLYAQPSQNYEYGEGYVCKEARTR